MWECPTEQDSSGSNDDAGLMRLGRYIWTLCSLLSACSLTATGQSSSAAPSVQNDPKQVSPAATAEGQADGSSQTVTARELQLLSLLGWEGLYEPSGYSINSILPSNCSQSTWQALGSLHSLVNLTLTGSLPDLPTSWAGTQAFPALQSVVLAASNLSGTLPAEWSQSPALAALRVLNLSATHISGSSLA